MAGGKFVTFLIILLFSFLGLISLGFRLPIYLRYEILFIFILIIIAVIMSIGVYYNGDWAWLIASMFFLIVLINLFYVYLKISSAFITFGIASLFSSVGFFMSMVSLKKRMYRKEEIEIVQPPSKVSKEFTPGKYIASETGKRYHIPKCRWAKKISKNKAVWFDTEKQARRNGYKKDKCVG